METILLIHFHSRRRERYHSTTIRWEYDSLGKNTIDFIPMTWLKATSLGAILISFAACQPIDPADQLTLQVTNNTQQTIDYLSVSTDKAKE